MQKARGFHSLVSRPESFFFSSSFFSLLKPQVGKKELQVGKGEPELGQDEPQVGTEEFSSGGQ